MNDAPVQVQPLKSSPTGALRRRSKIHRWAAIGVAVAVSALSVVLPQNLAAAADPTPSWLHTQGSAIVTESGQEFTIRAVNWFGLETSNCAPHGLWTISLDQAMDQMASFGFNTIRLPFSSECLAGSAGSVNGIHGWLNADLVGLTPVQIMDRVVTEAASRNMRVILDRHRPDSGSQSELWYTNAWSEQRWISDWVALANRYAGNPTVIGADLHNEPHGNACWGCGNPATDWAAAATRAGNAVLAANPHWLVIVEGVERQTGAAGSTWWGGGLADVAARPITLSVAGQLVYSVHDYPASVYAQPWFADPSYPQNLPAIWNRNFGYLQQQNTAPVFVGEFGTKLQTASDIAWLTTLVGYLAENRLSFAYWSYNPNSGDTGGLVADDWRTPQTAKLAALAPLLGATPPTTSTAPTSATTTSTALPPTTTGTPTTSTTAKTTTVTPTTSAAAVPPTATWSLQSSWQAGYVAQLTLKAPTAAVTSWTVSWPDPTAKAVTNSWGMTCTLASGVQTCRGAGWAAKIAKGGSVTVGLQVSNSGTPPQAPRLTVS